MPMKTTGLIPFIYFEGMFCSTSVTSTLAFENCGKFTEMPSNSSNHPHWPPLWEEWEHMRGSLLCLFFLRVQREGHSVTSPPGTLQYHSYHVCWKCANICILPYLLKCYIPMSLCPLFQSPVIIPIGCLWGAEARVSVVLCNFCECDSQAWEGPW